MKEHKKTKVPKTFLINNLLLIFAVIIITIIPILMLRTTEFAGADDKAKNAIQQIDGNYKPWFNPLWEPPSAEISSFLFALQAAIGAGFIGYFIGLSKGKKARENDIY